MQFVIKHVRMILPVLGFDFLEPKPSPTKDPTESTKSRSPIFHFSMSGTDAWAQEVSGRFFVLEGSKARALGNPSWTAYKKLREELIFKGKLVLDTAGPFLIFDDNVEFSSPSAAAAVVYGGNINGPANWKTEDGTTYKSWASSDSSAPAGAHDATVDNTEPLMEAQQPVSLTNGQ